MSLEADVDSRRNLTAAPSAAVEENLWTFPAAQLRRLAAVGLLGAAVFLIQAGALEIVLRSDRLCREARQANWAVNPAGCQSETVRYLIQGLARGPVGAFRPELPPVVGVLTTAAAVAVVAALLGFLPLRHAIPAFLLLELLAAVAFGFLGYARQYIG